MDISYKTIADLIIVIVDMSLDYDNNSIEDLLVFLEKYKDHTIYIGDS